MTDPRARRAAPRSFFIYNDPAVLSGPPEFFVNIIFSKGVAMKYTPWGRAWLAAGLLGLALGRPAPLPPSFPSAQPLAALPAAPSEVSLPTACGYLLDGGSDGAVQAIPDHVGTTDGVITSTIVLTGNLPYIWTMGLYSSVTHTYSGDLEITLISPAGTRVTLTSRNGGPAHDVFSYTVWADQNNIPVTDADFSHPVAPRPLVPEEALGAFRGEKGAGAWQLVVADKVHEDTGTFRGWLIQIASLNRAPVTTTTSFSASPAASIPTTTAPLKLNIPVSGVAHSLLAVNLTTHIVHAQPGALEFSLASPEAISTTISTGNGGSHANWFNGTRWDDTAGKLYPPGPVTDDVHSSGVLTAAVPEGAMGHFLGTDPNGTWSLSIQDVLGVGGGSVPQWGLDVTTGFCPGAVYLPVLSRN
jgi:subtilisin-like proprotein convertase family protein